MRGPSLPYFGTFDLGSAGSCLVAAWLAAVLWSPTVVPSWVGARGLIASVPIWRLSLLLGLCATLLCLDLLRRLSETPWKTVLGIVSGFVAALLFLFANFDAFGAASGAVVVAGGASLGFLLGLVSALLVVSLSAMIDEKNDYGQAVVNSSASLIAAGATLVLLSLLNGPIAIFVAACLPAAASSVLAVLAKDSNSQAKSDGFASLSAGGQGGMTTKLVESFGHGACAIVFSWEFAAGFSGLLVTGFASAGFAPFLLGLALALSGAVMLVLMRLGFVCNGDAFAILFPVCSMALLTMVSVLGCQKGAPFLIAMFFGVAVCRVPNAAYRAESSCEVSGALKGALRAESATCAAFAHLFGWAYGMLVMMTSGLFERFFAFSLAAFVVIAAASIGFLVGFRGSFGKGMGSGGGRNQVSLRLIEEWDETCVSLSAHFVLSARESEVLVLLSRGRDRQYIHRKLGISPSTVRTHTYNLYRKLDVHDQQELIDMVEHAFVERIERE